MYGDLIIYSVTSLLTDLQVVPTHSLVWTSNTPADELRSRSVPGFSDPGPETQACLLVSGVFEEPAWGLAESRRGTPARGHPGKHQFLHPRLGNQVLAAGSSLPSPDRPSVLWPRECLEGLGRVWLGRAALPWGAGAFSGHPGTWRCGGGASQLLPFPAT